MNAKFREVYRFEKVVIARSHLQSDLGAHKNYT